MAGFSNDVMYADNVDFSGGKSATVLLDGELLIGSSVAPNIRVGTLTAGAGISITNGNGSILITNTGGGGGGSLTTLNAQSGAATQSGGVINVVGTTGLTTIGAGMTLTISPANDLAALEALTTTGYAVRTALETWTTRTFQAGSGISLINADGVAGNTTITADTNVPTTFTGDVGTATPAANNINIVGTGSTATAASGSSVVVALTGMTNHAVLVGAGTGTLTKLGVGTNGQVLIGATTADPAFATLTSSDSSISFTTGVNTLSLQVTGGSTVGKTITGQSGGALSPTAGNWNISGAVTAAGTSPVVTSGAVSTLTVNVQTSQALAAADATKIGLSNFDSASFAVAATGFVTLSTTGVGKTITGDSGGALSPSSNNWNILGLSGSKTSGSGATLTVKSPPFSQIGSTGTSVLNTGEFVTATATRTLPASAGLIDGDLFIFVCTTANLLTIQAVSAQKIRIGSQISSAAGTIVSTAIGNSITLRFNAADGFFYAVSMVGNWTFT